MRIILLTLLLGSCLSLSLSQAQTHTVHAIHSTGAFGYNTSVLPHSVAQYQGYLTVVDWFDGGGSRSDIHIMWGDTCRGYNAKSRYYRTSGPADEYPTAVQMDPTGDLWIVGLTTNGGLGAEDAFLMRVDTANNLPLVFVKTFGGLQGDYFEGLTLTSDGGALLYGQSVSFGATTQEGFVVKVDASGNLQWSRQIGGNNWDMFYDAVETSDGGYILLGTSFSFSFPMDVWFVKLSSAGNVVFSKAVNNPSSRWCVGYDLFKTPDGGYIVNGGEVNGVAQPNDADGMLMKFDANLAYQWGKVYGGTGWDDLIDCTPTDDDGDGAKDDGYMLVGYNASLGGGNDDFWYVKTDLSGNVQWSRGWDEGGVGNGFASVEQISYERGYVMVGSFDKGVDNSRLVVLRTKNDGTGNFSCPTPLITPRVLNITRTVSNAPVTTTANLGTGNPAFTSYGQIAAIAVCCCDDWPNNCRAGILDGARSLRLQARPEGRAAVLEWFTEATGILEYRLWMGASPDALDVIGTSGPGVTEVTQAVDGAGRYYFQVEARDQDGETWASEIVAVQIGSGEALWLDGNVVEAGARPLLHLQGAPDGRMPWTLVDMQGRVITSGTAQLDGVGAATVSLETAQLAAGSYVARSGSATARLVVR